MVTDVDTAQSADLVDALVQLSFTLQTVLVGAAASVDLSLTQLRLLGILRDRTPAMTDLAVAMGLDRSSVSGLIDRAERRGLVTRTASTEDARVTMVRATSSGLELARAVEAVVTAEVEALVARVPRRDRECMVRVATSIVDVHLERSVDSLR
jgi:DNA-binding MarR family transcriptional regulator